MGISYWYHEHACQDWQRCHGICSSCCRGGPPKATTDPLHPSTCLGRIFTFSISTTSRCGDAYATKQARGAGHCGNRPRCVMLMGACAQLSHPNESAVSSTIFQFLTRGTFVTDGRCCSALSLSFCMHAHLLFSNRIACKTLQGPFPEWIQDMAGLSPLCC